MRGFILSCAAVAAGDWVQIDPLDTRFMSPAREPLSPAGHNLACGMGFCNSTRAALLASLKAYEIAENNDPRSSLAVIKCARAHEHSRSGVSRARAAPQTRCRAARAR